MVVPWAGLQLAPPLLRVGAWSGRHGGWPSCPCVVRLRRNCMGCRGRGDGGGGLSCSSHPSRVAGV